MNIRPVSIARLSRPLLHEIDGELIIDGVHYASDSLVPLGKFTQMPMNLQRSQWDTNDAYRVSSNVRADILRDQDHGHMFMEAGSFSMSTKPLIGMTTIANIPEAFAQYNRPFGHLYQNDSRLPTHFQSTSGVTAGKTFVCTTRGILEVKNGIRRGVVANGEPFYPGTYNGLSGGADSSTVSVQQLILGETESEFFGISWFDHGSAYFDGPSTSGRPSTLMWRSTKRADTIDTITPIKFSQSSDTYELVFLGVYSGKMIALRTHSTGTLSQAPRLTDQLGQRPISMNLQSGAVAQPPLASNVIQPAGQTGTTGIRFATHVRSVLETESTISVFLVAVQASAVTHEGVLNGVSIRRFDLDKASDVWSYTDVSVTNGVYGEVMQKSPTPVTGLNNAQSLITSWFVESQGSTYLVVMHLGTNARLDVGVNVAHEEYTHQYVYKLEANGSLTMVSKLVQSGLFGRSETNAGFAMSDDRRAMYMNTYEGGIRRLIFDDSTLTYQEHMRIQIDAWSFHIDTDETLTAIDTAFNLYRLKPTLGSVIRATIGEVPLFDGTPIAAVINVSALNHKGERVVAQVKLELDGPIIFAANTQKTLTLTTSETADVPVPVQITASGEIYCTPLVP